MVIVDVNGGENSWRESGGDYGGNQRDSGEVSNAEFQQRFFMVCTMHIVSPIYL